MHIYIYIYICIHTRCFFLGRKVQERIHNLYCISIQNTLKYTNKQSLGRKGVGTAFLRDPTEKSTVHTYIQTLMQIICKSCTYHIVYNSAPAQSHTYQLKALTYLLIYLHLCVILRTASALQL